jgi:hypothetical protein
MAKDKNQPQPKKVNEAEEDELGLVLSEANRANEEISAQIDQQIQDAEKKRLMDEIICRRRQSSYWRLSKKLEVRKRRRESNITLKTLKEVEILEDKMSGFILTPYKIALHTGKKEKDVADVDSLEVEFTVSGEPTKKTYKIEKKDGKYVTRVPGSISPIQFDRMKEEIISRQREELKKSTKDYDDELNELEIRYPGFTPYWRW